jgi:DNA-directed RNA polymerase specialized sigma24 family protein
MKKLESVNPDTEKELLARALVNREAFGAIYEHYYPRLYNYVLVRVGDHSLADDLVSSIFEKTVRKLSSYNQGERAFFHLAFYHCQPYSDRLFQAGVH